MGSEFIFSCREDESQWIVQIKKMLKEELDDDISFHASIYHVPKSLSIVKPEAYSPQLIALGPYHHLRPDLYDMERYKLAAAKKIHLHFKNLDFQCLVNYLKKEELNIRACYHKYLNFSCDTLTYIMAIDGLFLLNILHANVNKKDILHGALETSQLGKKLTKDSILRDIMMLENQIPFFFLKEILSIESSQRELIDDLLPSMLLNFCRSLCPVKLDKEYYLPKVLNNAHILDLMYHMILHDSYDSECTASSKDQNQNKKQNQSPAGRNCCFKVGNPVDDISSSWKLASNLNFGFMKEVKVPVDAAMKIIPGVNKIISQISDKNSSSGGGEDADGPLVESLKMPKVSFLHVAGVRIKKAPNIKSIKFDLNKVTLYIPGIKLDVNSEVVLRNLVAYEAVAMTDSLVFSRYMELMNGIIDTEEDVKLLVDKGIITSQLPYDEVAKIFNGMSKSIGLTAAENIDKTIEAVNKFYDGIPKVMAYKAIKRYVFASWNVLTVLASLLLLGLMVFQSFCSVYNCPRYFNVNTKMA